MDESARECFFFACFRIQAARSFVPEGARLRAMAAWRAETVSDSSLARISRFDTGAMVEIGESVRTLSISSSLEGGGRLPLRRLAEENQGLVRTVSKISVPGESVKSPDMLLLL